MFASLNACVRANPFESAIVVYGLGLFAAAAMYATQIMHAVLMYNPPSVPKNTPQMMYLVPPAVTVIISILGIRFLGKDQLGAAGSIMQLALPGIMMVGWLVTGVMWGQCHLNAQNTYGKPWSKVCYQSNLTFEDHGYIHNVNHKLGDAVVTLGATTFLIYVIFLWKTWRDRVKGGGDGDDEESYPATFQQQPPEAFHQQFADVRNAREALY